MPTISQLTDRILDLSARSCAPEGLPSYGRFMGLLVRLQPALEEKYPHVKGLFDEPGSEKRKSLESLYPSIRNFIQGVNFRGFKGNGFLDSGVFLPMERNVDALYIATDIGTSRHLDSIEIKILELNHALHEKKVIGLISHHPYENPFSFMINLKAATQAEQLGVPFEEFVSLQLEETYAVYQEDLNKGYYDNKDHTVLGRITGLQNQTGREFCLAYLHDPVDTIGAVYLDCLFDKAKQRGELNNLTDLVRLMYNHPELNYF
ncbi:MAG: hypothetical protein V1859_03700 [archaeon]